jgi:toxin ParE1/3/4
MAYLVNLSLRAQRDLARIYTRIEANDSGAALKWYRDFRRAILSLEEQPNRCAATPENEKLKQLLYGNKPHIYRAIYRVVEKQKQVEVLHIRHGAKRGFTGADVE